MPRSSNFAELADEPEIHALYVVSFYSFKGGVGRTMALVNIAYEMAVTGRRVLVVDFDLEAPGIDTFNLPRPQTATKGMVEFVKDYVETGQVPDASEYMYQASGIGGDEGALWIMPAGMREQEYAFQLGSIDWQDLYSLHDGFLLFEDLKAQWKSLVAPDYVLIDSRTGYSDIAGICTRQLPDAVVVLFFPNEQNLRGLEKVVRDIHEEMEGQPRRHIQLHFVPSNVPDIFDPDQELETRIGEFRQRLAFDETGATIHHFSGLALINQVIFTKEHPRSQLTAEYKQLLRSVVRQNPEDREGALAFLGELGGPPPRSLRRSRRSVRPIENVERRLEAIRAAHPTDGEILYRLGTIREREGRTEEATALFAEAVEHGCDLPDVLIRKAELDQRLGALDQGLQAIRRALANPEASFFEVRRGLGWLRDFAESELASVDQMGAVRGLDFAETLRLCGDPLSSTRQALPAAERLIRGWIEHPSTSELEKREASRALILNLIGQGRFEEAMLLVAEHDPDPQELDEQDAFNYAMAKWGEAGYPAKDYFRRVIELDPQAGSERPKANYAQCLAIAHWAVGDASAAEDFIAKAKQRVVSRLGTEFSAWRYLTVRPSEFLDDLESLAQMIRGKDLVPVVFQAAGRP
jgi:MinD-like ATPase involved in chromosome partitioning or flagellar assembly/tetratricopeptide (TPR) repeat protein